MLILLLPFPKNENLTRMPAAAGSVLEWGRLIPSFRLPANAETVPFFPKTRSPTNKHTVDRTEWSSMALHGYRDIRVILSDKYSPI